MLIRQLWAAFLDALLGTSCPFGCGQRLFPRDRRHHFDLDHAGDQEALR